MSYAPLDPKNTVMLFADLQAGIIELTATNELARLRRAVAAVGEAGADLRDSCGGHDRAG